MYVPIGGAVAMQLRDGIRVRVTLRYRKLLDVRHASGTRRKIVHA